MDSFRLGETKCFDIDITLLHKDTDRQLDHKRYENVRLRAASSKPATPPALPPAPAPLLPPPSSTAGASDAPSVDGTLALLGGDELLLSTPFDMLDLMLQCTLPHVSLEQRSLYASRLTRVYGSGQEATLTLLYLREDSDFRDELGKYIEESAHVLLLMRLRDEVYRRLLRQHKERHPGIDRVSLLRDFVDVESFLKEAYAVMLQKDIGHAPKPGFELTVEGEVCSPRVQAHRSVPARSWCVSL